MGYEIIRKFRANYTPSAMGGYRVKKKSAASAPRPTFTEFVKYVLDCVKAKTKVLDMHWTPAWSFCNLCQVKFTDIVLLETFDRDQAYILNKTGIGWEVAQPRKVNTARDGKNSMSLVDDYIAELEKDTEGQDLIRGLCQLYVIDFMIFDYHYEKCGF